MYEFLVKAQRQARIAAIQEILNDHNLTGQDEEVLPINVRTKAIEICLMFEEWIGEITYQSQQRQDLAMRFAIEHIERVMPLGSFSRNNDLKVAVDKLKENLMRKGDEETEAVAP